MIAIIASFLSYLTEFFAIFVGVFYFLTFLENRKSLDKLPEVKEYPSVTVIIPAFNEEKFIAATIDSAANLDYPKEKLKILVVNDGSKDRTLEIAKETAKKYENIQIIDKPNGGKAQSMNLALKEVKTDLVATLDADSYVMPHSLKKMVPYFFKNPKVAAVTASMKIKDPKTFLQKIQGAEYLMSIYLKKMMSFINGIMVTPGPFSVYRTSIFNSIGGFDENNITEDGEIALRIQKYQHLIEHSHEAEVYTNAPATIDALKRQRIRWNRGTLRNFVKYKSILGDPKYGDFGLFVFPSSIAFLILAFDLLILVFVRFIMTALKRWQFGTLIRLPKFAWENGFKIDTFFFQPTTSQFLAFAILLLSIASFYFVYKYSKKDFKTLALFYVPYILIYYPIFIIGFWIITLYYELTNKKLFWYK